MNDDRTVGVVDVDVDHAVVTERGPASFRLALDVFLSAVGPRILGDHVSSQREDLRSTVYAFPRTGVRPLRDAYRELLRRLDIDAIVHAQLHTAARPSIVNGQIAAAIRGEFGDVQFTERTRGSELFVNPLMAMYFTVDLGGLARRHLYLNELVGTDTQYEVRAVIESFRERVDRRQRRAIPH